LSGRREGHRCLAERADASGCPPMMAILEHA
jgi:hypothetical protein